MTLPSTILIVTIASMMSSSFKETKAQNSWNLNGNSNASTNSKLGTTNGIPLRLFTNNTVRMFIHPTTGNVGVGSTTPLTPLHVSGFGSFGNRVTATNATRALNLADDNAVMRVLRVHATNAPAVELISRTTADGADIAYWDFFAEPTDKSFRIRDRVGGGTGLTRLTISSNGYVGIGSTTPSQKLHVEGNGMITGSLSIGITAPATSSIFEINSNTKGALLPRMTTAQRNAISSPAQGLLIFQTDGTKGFYYYDGGWKPVTSETSGGTNTTLSNLTAPTAVNADLLPGTTASKDLGSTINKWKDLYLSGTIGINTTPLYPIDINNPNYENGIRVVNSYSSLIDHVGVSSTSVIGEGWGIGVRSEGGYIGTHAIAQGGIFDVDCYGVYSEAYGTNGSRIGVYSTANNPNEDLIGNFYGVYAEADGGSFNAPGYFVGDVWAVNYNNISDRKFKKGITPLKNTLPQIMKLKPSVFEFKTTEYTKMKLPKGEQIGMIADEVKQLFPQLVKPAVHPAKYDKNKTMVVSSEEKYEGVNYQGFIPVLVASIQEQQLIIDNQQQLLNQLKAEYEDLKVRLTKLESLQSNNSGSISSNRSLGYLEQNTPNPFNNSTMIRYYVPINSFSAKIVITDVTGSVRKSIAINHKGNSNVTLNAHSLPPGSFFYTLWVEGKEVDSKQLIITR